MRKRRGLAFKRESAKVEVDVLVHRLREARERLGWSQEKVAADLGLEASWIQAVESDSAADTPFALVVLYARHVGAVVDLRPPGRRGPGLLP